MGFVIRGVVGVWGHGEQERWSLEAMLRDVILLRVTGNRLEKGQTVLLTLGESSPKAHAYSPATSGPRSRQRGGGRRVVRFNRVVLKALVRRRYLYKDLKQVKGRALEI